MPKETHRWWQERLAEAFENMPDGTLAELEDWLFEQSDGRPHGCPTEPPKPRTIQDYRKKHRDRPPQERAEYRYLRWPESFSPRGPLPAESAATLLREAALALEAAKRLTLRWAQGYWSMHLAALHGAARSAPLPRWPPRVGGDSGPRSNGTTRLTVIEGYLMFEGWSSAAARDLAENLDAAAVPGDGRAGSLNGEERHRAIVRRGLVPPFVIQRGDPFLRGDLTVTRSDGTERTGG